MPLAFVSTRAEILNHLESSPIPLTASPGERRYWPGGTCSVISPRRLSRRHGVRADCSLGRSSDYRGGTSKHRMLLASSARIHLIPCYRGPKVTGCHRRDLTPLSVFLLTRLRNLQGTLFTGCVSNRRGATSGRRFFGIPTEESSPQKRPWTRRAKHNSE